MNYKPKYFDKVYPIHLEALQNKDYKYLVLAYKYVLRFHDHKKYRRIVGGKRIRILKK